MAGSINLTGVAENVPQDQGGRFFGAHTWNSATNHLLFRRALGNITEGAAGAAGYSDAGSVLVDANGVALTSNAAALGDAEGNPTVGGLVSYNKVFDGTNWVRARTAKADNSSLGTVGVPVVGLVAGDGSVFRGVTSIGAMSDANSAVNALAAGIVAYNGTTWDRQYNNAQGTLLASAARTATTQSADQTNYNARGVIVFLNITVASGTGGLFVQIFGKDPVSGNYLQINTNTTRITTTGYYGFEVYPGASATSALNNTTVAQFIASALPRVWAAAVNAGDASSYTYSLGYSTII